MSSSSDPSNSEKLQLADRPPPLTREEVIERIKDEAPFLQSREVMARKFTYKSPMPYEIGDSPAGYILYMLHLKTAMKKDLDQYKLEVTRTFSPDPNTVIVRWKMTWQQDGDLACASGSTTYGLNPDELVAKIEDRWTAEGEIGTQPYFAKCFAFSQAWRPYGIGRFSRESLPLATRHAAWETLKEDPNYGGQLTREEMDVVTDQVMLALAGLSASIGLLLMVVGAKLIVS